MIFLDPAFAHFLSRCEEKLGLRESHISSHDTQAMIFRIWDLIWFLVQELGCSNNWC